MALLKIGGGQLDIQMLPGVDRVVRITIRNTATRQPLDLSGYTTAILQARSPGDTGAVVLTATTIQVSATAPNLILTLPGQASQAMQTAGIRAAAYDLLAGAGTNPLERLLYGRIEIVPRISR